jgi:hypothetical protein
LIHLKAEARLLDIQSTMSHWQPITTAPYDHPIEVGVLDHGQYHALVFLVRRTPMGWKGEHGWIAVNPTHWHDSSGCGLDNEHDHDFTNGKENT